MWITEPASRTKEQSREGNVFSCTQAETAADGSRAGRSRGQTSRLSYQSCPHAKLDVAQSMLLFGGNDMAGGWLSTMDIFTPSSKQWVVMGQMPSQRGYGAAAAVSGHVYLMGGGAGTEWQNDVLRYDIPADEWFQVPLTAL